MIEPRLRASGRSDAILSYSQNAEDVRLLRVFDDVDEGFYVDVGAADPVAGSVTHLFYERGWSGINVEPNPVFLASLEHARTSDVNLGVAVGTADGSSPFFVTHPDLGMSTVDLNVHEHARDAIERVEEIIVSRRPLASILREHASERTIHFLKVDVEGAEQDVLASSDWEAFRPIVVLVEAVESWSTTPTYEAWEPILLDADYCFAAFDGVNRFYVDREHELLIPTLAYPLSALDHYVRASDRDRIVRAEDEARRADEQRLALEERIEVLERELARAEADARTQTAKLAGLVALHRSLASTEADLAHVQHELSTVYASPTWRAGLVIASFGRPLLRFARRLRRPNVRTRRVLRPAHAYAAAVRPGQPWHFARKRPRIRAPLDASPLSEIADCLGAAHVSIDARRASAVEQHLDRLGWCDAESLHTRRLSWEERQAALEVDAIVALARHHRDDAPATATESGKPMVVVDTRSLQDPVYAMRGVGVHGRRVLEAIRKVSAGMELGLLTSAELPDLDETVVGMADRVIVTPYAVRAADVRLFVQLSAMTASCAPTVPFLCEPGCRTASVVYDFIPTEFPAAYLRTAHAVLTNRARIEALRHYDLLLPISRASGEACRRFLGDVPTRVTGVGDPLAGVEPSPEATAARPFMLVPGGGDPRKNVAAALAALAGHRRREGGSLRAVVTGVLTPAQQSTLVELVDRLGLPPDALDLRGYVADSDLAGLYATAELAFVASVAEGFSIPVAEAVLRGTPVVASDIPAHRELAGAGSWLARADDVDGLGRAIGHVLRDRERAVQAQRAQLGDTAHPSGVLRRIESALEPLLARDRRPTERAWARPARPRLAVLAPIPPLKSGVADYTAYTFGQVARYADVEIYASVSAPSSSLPVRALSAAPYLDKHVDAVVTVVGNSHLNFPMLDFLGSYGGACIAHDNRMLEAYQFDRGHAWTAVLLSRRGNDVRPEEIPELMVNLDRLPSTAYDLIARQASPLIVHGRALAQRLVHETGVSPVVLPFVPYNVPDVEAVGEAARVHARRTLGLSNDVFHFAIFGIIDARTKGSDLVVGALSWLRSWGTPAHLHVVGDGPVAEVELVERLAEEFGVATELTLHGHVTSERLKDFLLAVDAAVQIRTSALLSLSGSLADCIAFGVPTVTTDDVAAEMGAPAYVITTGGATSSLLIAEGLDKLRGLRRLDAAAIEGERRTYLAERSVDAYARGLLAALALWSD